jgi:hypothetical protein
MAKKYQIHGKFGGGSTKDIYVLKEGETVENAPEEAAIVIDPFTEPEDVPSLDGYAKTEDIPTDEHINGLINTALGVIENGTY